MKSALVLAASSLVLGSARPPAGFGPTIESARRNGPQIFNAIHNAMREFGSALHHNGMSLFPAVIPEGVVLHHGTHTREVPKDLDWLAFEVEHAEAFARGRWRRPNDTDGESHAEGGPPMPPPSESGPGYLHIYQAERPLHVLYIDGTSAGKSDLGTTDTQDILLGGNKSRIPWDEWARAANLCSLAEEWRLDGFIRMEPGFEIVHCDFTNGLRQVSANQRPSMDDPGETNNRLIASFEWARAASERYDGIGSSRVLLDFSSVVSAFFYPINLTNPDPKRPELPRLLEASDEEMRIVKQHVGESIARSKSRQKAPVDWQGVTDMIVTRYSRRLLFIAQTDLISVVRSEINGVLDTYIDYSETDDEFTAAKRRCTEFYLQPVHPETPEDHLIYAALENTTAIICNALFDARQLIVEESERDESAAINATKQIVNELIGTLSWYEWKQCGKCQPDEVCFIAMWPFGDVEDHYNPSCKNFSSVLGHGDYWGRPGKGPGKGPGKRPPPPPPLCMNGQDCGDGENRNEEL